MYRRDSCAYSFASAFLQISSAHAHAQFSAEHDTRSDRGNRKHCTYYLNVSYPTLYSFILIRNIHPQQTASCARTSFLEPLTLLPATVVIRSDCSWWGVSAPAAGHGVNRSLG